MGRVTRLENSGNDLRVKTRNLCLKGFKEGKSKEQIIEGIWASLLRGITERALLGGGQITKERIQKWVEGWLKGWEQNKTKSN